MSGRHSSTERKGISRVQKCIEEDFEWIFREQPISDYGIDAHIETVDDNNDPTGKLVALQIKTGKSHFYENGEFYTFYIDSVHYDYWINHSLPVLIVGCILEENIIIWEEVRKDNVEETKKGYKILLKRTNLLTTDYDYKIKRISEGNVIDRKLRKLVIDRDLILFIHKGGKISIEYEDWINKTLSRGFLKLFVNDTNEIKEYCHQYMGMNGTTLINILFPWADFELDEDFYEINCDLYDEEDEEYRLNKVKEAGMLYPYTNAMGEVDLYRVRLTLNEFGESLIHFYDYMDS